MYSAFNSVFGFGNLADEIVPDLDCSGLAIKGFAYDPRAFPHVLTKILVAGHFDHRLREARSISDRDRKPASVAPKLATQHCSKSPPNEAKICAKSFLYTELGSFRKNLHHQ